MSTENNEDLFKIEFNKDWLCRSTDNSSSTDTNEDCTWKPINLPHIISKNEYESNCNEQSWWYRKEFTWNSEHIKANQQIHLLFESTNNEDIDEYSTGKILTVWLNKIQIYSEKIQSHKITIHLTEYLFYKDEFNSNDEKNLVFIFCKDTSLCLHSYLLVPHDYEHALDVEKPKTTNIKPIYRLPLRKNRVLDYLVGFNVDDDQLDVVFNSNLKYPVISKLSVPPKIIVDDDDDDDQSNKQTREPIEEYPVPRLAIVMLVVGTRGDVQPFIAFGQTLRAAGHRVRLATHEKFRQFVREHGLEFYPLASNPEDLMTFMVKNGGVVPSISSIIEGDLEKKRRDIANILVSTWHACTENDDETSAPFKAEVIIANPPSFGHVHCAQKLQIPLHIIFTMPWSATADFPHAFYKTDHPKISKEKLNLLSYCIIDTLTWSGMRDLVNQFREETLGLSPLHTRQATHMLIDDQVPHTYCWSPSLVPAPHDWPPHVNVSGYFFLNDDNSHYKPSEDLANFLGLNLKENDEKPSSPIYIGFGSITGNDSHHLFQVILDALQQTGYRALLSGFDEENVELSDHILRIGDTPHDWLFQHVSAVCHHGGAGSVAAGLRAGKPSIIVPFFGDQFFWGNVVAKNGAGPEPIPGKHITVDRLVDAFKQVHEQKMINAAQRIREAISHENGCLNALHVFHSHLPLSRMQSDLESTYPACYRVDEFDLQISRPVAQVLIATGTLDQSHFRLHPTRKWTSVYDHRAHVPASGVIKHTHKAFSHIFIQSTKGMKRVTSSDNLFVGTSNGIGNAIKNIGKGAVHLPLGVLSLYGEMTDVLDRVPSLYDRYNESNSDERPAVVDFKSGVKAAGYSLSHGWKEGLTGLVRKPRVGYHRDGILGGATGAAIATANGIIKPTVGSLSSVTWLGRGVYANVQNKRKKSKNRSNEKHLNINSPSLQSSSALSPSMSHDDDEEEKKEQENDDDDDIPQNIRFASIVSGYPVEICQQILDEFEKFKKHQEEINAHSPTETRKHRIRRHRRHSDSTL